MEGEEGGGIRLSKRFDDNKGSNGHGEVDYKTKAGTAWSHSYLNQKPWHPLSYPNQRRKWIAEQTHAHRQSRAQEVAREYAQEQEFFRQTALISKKEKEKIEMMQAVSFMYVRPPGYNAESAKAAEISDERKREHQDNPSQLTNMDLSSSSALPPESLLGTDRLGQERKKPRPKDVFGRPLPTEEEFQVLKNAPRLETGVPARAKPFGIEVRNVKCARCGNFGHQSGDRECPLKDAIMPNEENRLKRDDPLTAIMAQMDPSEPLKWELKQKPGMSPPHGGFNLDDPNQQIIAEDIFDEYGGFLSGGNIPELLTNFSDSKPQKKPKKSKHKRKLSPSRGLRGSERNRPCSPFDDGKRSSKKDKIKKKKKKHLNQSESSASKDLEFDGHSRKSKHKCSYSSDDSDSDRQQGCRKSRQRHLYSSDKSDSDTYGRRKNSRKKHSYSSEHSPSDRHNKKSKLKPSYRHSFDDSEPGGHYRRKHHSRYHHHQSDTSSE